MKAYYSDTYVTIYHGDSRQVLPQIKGIGLCFTSPPYLNQRQYELNNFDWYNVVPTAMSLVQLAEGGQMLINLGVVHKNGEVVPYWNELVKRLKSEGFRFFGQYVWDQGDGLPGDWGGRLSPSYEMLFHFNKQPRQANKIVKCRRSGDIVSSTGMRLSNGNMSGYTYNNSPVSEKKVPDSVIRVYREMSRLLDHPARFPVRFANFIIQAFGKPGDIIVDPFVGSGTTLFAAKQLNYQCIGIDIEEKYCEMAALRCSQEVLPLACCAEN